jgi:outer membrane immunogenic protein
MKKLILAAALGSLMSGAALAADMGARPASYYAPPAPAGFRWAGLYAGLNLGYQWGSTTNNPTNPSGVAGGGQLGYNWQSGSFVFGVETDLQLSGADDTFAPWKFSNPWFGTLRGRAGFTFSNILFYGTLGLAYGDLKAETSGLSELRTEVGLTAGLGMEVGFANNWSAKIEYLYMDLASRGFSLTGVDNGMQSSFLRVGVNYHF